MLSVEVDYKPETLPFNLYVNLIKNCTGSLFDVKS